MTRGSSITEERGPQSLRESPYYVRIFFWVLHDATYILACWLPQFADKMYHISRREFQLDLGRALIEEGPRHGWKDMIGDMVVELHELAQLAFLWWRPGLWGRHLQTLLEDHPGFRLRPILELRDQLALRPHALQGRTLQGLYLGH